MILNGINLDWQTEDDLPSYCGRCPFWYGHNSCIPSIMSDEGGMCNLRSMNKKRYDDCPQGCLKLFRKVFKYPADAKLVIVLKDKI